MGRTQQRRKQPPRVVKTTSKEMNVILGKCRKLGCVIEWSGTTHVRICHPEWEHPLYVSGTPGSSYCRAVQNTRSQINRQNRQAGIELV